MPGDRPVHDRTRDAVPAGGGAAECARPAADAACFHCGAPNSGATRWRGDVAGAPRAFCCAGCLAIAQTIDGAGLASFYRARTAAPAAAGDVAGGDDFRQRAGAARAAGLIVVGPEGREEATLHFEGMTCGACVWLLERWLGSRPGVAHASVNFATRRGRLAWDPRTTSLEALLAASSAIGYPAHPYDPARREALARREGRAALARMAVAWLGMMQVMMFALPAYITVEGIAAPHRRLLDWASLVLTLPVLLYSAAPFFRGALRDLRHRRPGMDVPVALGLGAAFCASVVATLRGDGAVYYDSVTMFVALLSTARYVELAARHRAGAAIEALARAAPPTAERVSGWPGHGHTQTVAATDLVAGDFVLVRPGATIPADGVVADGHSAVEEAVLTGESRPRERGRGDAVLAGSVNRDGSLVVEVRAAGSATRLAAVQRLTEQAAAARPRLARAADRVASWFVTALLVLAAGTAVWWWHADAARAVPVVFALLAVSCPCALSLATPAALAAAAGAFAHRRIVLVRPDALEALARVTHVVFDKTGTLTEGRFRLADVAHGNRVSRRRALEIAAALEMRSEHPVALAIRAVATAGTVAKDVVVVAGQGVEGTVDGVRWRIGRRAFVAALAGRAEPEAPLPADGAATEAVLGDAQGVVAVFACTDALRPDAAALIARLRRAGVGATLLSGDRAPAAAAVGRAAGIDDARGELTPEAKCAAIAALQSAGAVVAMVGDGVNDAPALAQSHVSLSLASATPLAQWTADVVILGASLAPIGDALEHARRTRAVIRQNLGWAAVYNTLAVPAAALGVVTPLAAAAGMSLSSLAVVGNALRLARMSRRARDAGTIARVAPALRPGGA